MLFHKVALKGLSLQLVVSPFYFLENLVEFRYVYCFNYYCRFNHLVHWNLQCFGCKAESGERILV